MFLVSIGPCQSAVRSEWTSDLSNFLQFVFEFSTKTSCLVTKFQSINQWKLTLPSGMYRSGNLNSIKSWNNVIFRFWTDFLFSITVLGAGCEIFFGIFSRKCYLLRRFNSSFFTIFHKTCILLKILVTVTLLNICKLRYSTVFFMLWHKHFRQSWLHFEYGPNILLRCMFFKVRSLL